MKLTPWYPPEVKPVRKGVYEVCFTALPWYRYWDGRFWWNGSFSPFDAFNRRAERFVNGECKDDWRGLAEEPI